MTATGPEMGGPNGGAAPDAEVVPGSRPRRRNGNQFREPPGTGGTTRFEALAGFLDRADKAPPAEWLIQDLAPGSGSLLLVAPSYVGKTWFALVIAKTAATGGRPVFFVEEEGSLRGFAQRLRDLAIPAELPISVSHLQGVRLDNTRTVRELAEMLQRATRPVLVLDPLTLLSAFDENDTAEASRLVQAFATLRRANPEGLLVVLHHTSKAGGRSGHAVHVARGSTVFGAWFDGQLNLQARSVAQGSRRVAFAIEVAKMRESERGAPRLVTLTLGTGEVSIETVEDTPEELVSAVRAMLEGSASPLSKNEICKALGGRRENVLAAVATLEAECQRDARGRLSLPKVAP